MNCITVMPGFAPARLVREAFRRGVKPDVFLYNHYPLSDRQEYLDICNENQVEFFDSGSDLGLHGSLNNWASAMAISPDIVILLDPDAFPNPTGWKEALCKVMEDQSVSLACLYVGPVERQVPVRYQINGVNVRQLPRTEMYGTTAWRWPVVWDQQCKYYGFLELAMESKLAKTVYLEDFRDDFGMATYPKELWDQDYLEWKIAHVHGDGRSFGEFLDFLKVKLAPT